jgi:flagellar hook-basal body complex protein FliE
MINSINTALPVPAISGATQTAGRPDDFQALLRSAVQTVDATRGNAEASVNAFLSGEGPELHSTILAAQKAELSMELFLQVRNKVVQAYQEIMRSQV